MFDETDSVGTTGDGYEQAVEAAGVVELPDRGPAEVSTGELPSDVYGDRPDDSDLPGSAP